MTLNNRCFIIHKTNHKKGHIHDYNIYKKNHLVTPKEVVNVFDLGYLGLEKDFPKQLSLLPYRKKRNCYSYLKSKKNTTKINLKRE
jgi:hypothetical protein